MIEKKLTAGEPSSAPPAFNWDLSQGEWYTEGDFPYWKTIMSRKTRGVVASNVKAEFAERIVKAINAESGAAQEVSPPSPEHSESYAEIKSALQAIIHGAMASEDTSPCHICRPSDEHRHEEACPILAAERLLRTGVTR